jgi:hypothetical protein
MSLSPRNAHTEIFEYKFNQFSPTRAYKAAQRPAKILDKDEKRKKAFFKLPPLESNRIRWSPHRSSMEKPFPMGSSKVFNEKNSKFSKIQRENNALRDFINNFHIKNEKNRVTSSLDVLSDGTTVKITEKVKKYFNQLEDYVNNLY